MTERTMGCVRPDENTPAEGVTDVAPESLLLSPFRPALHPDSDEVEGRSVAWARHFGLCDSEGEYEKLTRSRVGRLAARGFPHAGREGLQIAADWTTLFCLLDDKLEAVALTAIGAAEYVARLSSAFRERRSCDEPATRALADLRARIDQCGDDECVSSFAAALDQILAAFLWERINRDNELYPSITAYREMRAVTVGVASLFALAPLTDGIRLSPRLRAHKTLRSLAWLACSAVGITNDLFTFEREHVAGEVHNLVVLLMHERRMGARRARRVAIEQHDIDVREFLASSRSLPDAGAEGEAQDRYVAMLRSWVGGHLAWAYETGRYAAPSSG